MLGVRSAHSSTSILAACLIGVSAASCGIPPPRPGDADLSAKKVRYRGNLDGLVRVADSRLAELYQRPDRDLSRYTQILLDPLAFDSNMDTENVRYRERDLAVVRRNFRKIIERELRGQFPLVDFRAENVLRVRFTLTKLVANRPPRGVVDKGGVSQEVYRSVGVGEASMQVGVLDSQSDTLLVAAADRYRGWPLGSNNYANEVWGDVDKAFSMWGRLLRQRLAKSTASP